MNLFILIFIFAYLVWILPKGHTYLGMNLFILIFIFANLVWILPRDIHILGTDDTYISISSVNIRGKYISWDENISFDTYICISRVNITEGHTYLGMNLFILILIFAYLSVNNTEGHTYLGMNIFILIFIFAYLVWILPWDIHILGWTYFYWYLYLHI